MNLAQLICVLFWLVNTSALPKEKISPLKQFKSCLSKQNLNVGSSLVVRRRGLKYRNLNFQWNKGLPKIYPAAFILPENEKQVATIVQCGKSTKIHLVANGGGHSYTKVSFGDSTSVVISLQNLNSVSVQKSGKTGIIGAGGLLGPTFLSLWNKGKYFVPTGECMTIGVAGFYLGGGYSPFSRQYGIGSDQLVGANIVTADGKLKKVNKSKFPDLFWALRGGGLSSFGIVTQFQFRLRQAPELILFQRLIYKMSDFVQVFNSNQNILSGSYPEVIYIYFDALKDIKVDIYDLSGNYANIKEIVQRFPKPASKKFFKYTYPEFLLNTQKQVLSPQKMFKKPEDLAKITRLNSQSYYAKPRSFYVKKKMLNLNLLNPLIKTKPKDVEIYTESYMGAINKFKPDETAFVHRNGTIYDFVVRSYAKTKKSYLQAIPWIDEFYNLAKSLAQSKESYQNYPANELVDYLQEYYGSNLPRLMKIKKIYDPSNFFKTPQSIPPAL